MRNCIIASYLAISLCAVILLPAYTLFFLQPAFRDYITEDIQQDAGSLAHHFSELFFPEHQALTAAAITPAVEQQLKKLQEDFHLIKIKLFSPDGTVVFSTSKDDIGAVNIHDYFKDEVAQGRRYTKVVRKNRTSLEGQTMPVDVVETYVPIMKGSHFMGAFEIYYDITSQRRRLEALGHKSRNVGIVISLLLMAAALAAARHAARSLAAKERAEEALRRANDELEHRVEARTRDLAQLNDTLRGEIKKRKEIQDKNEELIAELTDALQKVKTLSGLLPICSSCQQIRDAEGEWHKVEDYIQRRTDAEFTHGICPRCAKRLYPDLYAAMEQGDGNK